MNPFLSDGKAKMLRKKGNCKLSQAYSLLCKAWWRWCHGMGMHVCLWNRPSQLYWCLMYHDSSRMNLEGYKTIFPTYILENATRLIGKWFILHTNNDTKHLASSVNEFIRAKKWKVLDCPSQSPELNPIECEFHQLKRRVKAETPPKQTIIVIVCIKGWERYFKGWDQESGNVYGSQTHCCDCAQGICK